MNNKFLENLKVGDDVGISSRYDRLHVSKVKRITKTLIVTESSKGYEEKFKRHSGCTGGSYSFDRLLEPTVEFYMQYNRELFIDGIKYHIAHSILEKMTNEELKDIYLKLKKVKEIQ